MANSDEPKSFDDSVHRPYGESLCWRCAHHRTVETPRSAFLLCKALPMKYPGQPMTSCPAFSPTHPESPLA